MKKYLMAFTAIVLTTAGAIAGRASAKADATRIFFSTGAGGSTHCFALTGSTFTGSAALTTGASVAHQASITSVGGISRNLYGTSTCSTSHEVQFHS